ncbi:MAG: hypothetical protein ABSC94_16550 [Polyangiaceae bacterium]
MPPAFTPPAFTPPAFTPPAFTPPAFTPPAFTPPAFTPSPTQRPKAGLERARGASVLPSKDAAVTCYDSRVRRGRGKSPVTAGAAAATLVAAAYAPLSCGTPAEPPELGDFTFSSSAPAANGSGASADFSATPSVPTCNLGPDGGVCACVDEPLVTDAPNIYFVLDHSGSMADVPEGGTGATKWETILKVIDNLITELGPRANFAAAVFPAVNDIDPCGCSVGAEVFPPTQGNAPAGTPGTTLVSWDKTFAFISPNGGTPTAATLRQLLPSLQSLSARSLPARTYVILATDGGPNCNSTATCSVDECQPNIAAVAGCPPQGPANCCVEAMDCGGCSCAEGCTDTDASSSAVAAIAAAGIPVYVIGVPGSEPYASVLDDLAESGGTARPSDAGVPAYYNVTSADQATELAAALDSIAAQITATCSLTLNDVPPAPDLVNVFIDEQPVPQYGGDGGQPNWSIDGTQVTLLGDTCSSIMSGQALDVRVVAGCPTVLH